MAQGTVLALVQGTVLALVKGTVLALVKGTVLALMQNCSGVSSNTSQWCSQCHLEVSVYCGLG